MFSFNYFGFGRIGNEEESEKGEGFGRVFIKGCGAWFIGLGLIRFSMEASGSVGPTFMIFFFNFFYFLVHS